MSDKIYVTEYEQNQYENIDYRNNPSLAIEAKYIKQKEPSYKNNVLIEALPPDRSVRDIYKDVAKGPLFSEAERKEDLSYRMHAIYRLQDFNMPSHQNIAIDNSLSIAIRRGYANKRVNTPEYIKELNQSSQNIRDREKTQMMKSEFLQIPNAISQNSGFLVMGISGGGKSTATNKALSYYPQVIVHPQIHNNYTQFTQVVWLKIECSYNGSIKGICQKFFSELDRLVGTNYSMKYGKKSCGIDQMIVQISHLTRLYAIGALVIDEIQHLSKNVQNEGLMNFFVSLANELNLPIIYIGTYKVTKSILARDFRHGRRSMGIGNVEFAFMEKEEHEQFLKRLWKYQWVKEPIELTDQIIDLFYEKTLGIRDRVVKLFMALQVEAMVYNDELITIALIKKVADTKFALTKHMIKAFHSKDLSILSQLDDMGCVDTSSIFDNAFQTIAVQEQIRQAYEAEIKSGKTEKEDLINELIISMSQFEYDMKIIEDTVKETVSELGVKTKKSVLKKRIMSKLLTLEDE